MLRKIRKFMQKEFTNSSDSDKISLSVVNSQLPGGKHSPGRRNGNPMTEKIKISNNAFIYPMPMVLIGTEYQNRANFMALAWINRVNANPPMLAISVNPGHLTAEAILANHAFSVNVPTIDMREDVEFCGTRSGRDTDKSAVFETFTGDIAAAPMIASAPLSMECRVTASHHLPSNILFIAEVAAAYTEKKFLTDGKVDIEKLKPFTLTMPDNRYWAVGPCLGHAWDAQKD